MTVNHDAVAALSTTASANKTLLRNVVVARMPYVLGDAEDSRNIILIDPATGAVTVDLMLLGRVFHYDPADTTTAHDGTSCLVSSDGLRYKLAVGTDVFAYAVLDNTHSAPPVSPTLGDAYLVAAAATGAWVGKSTYIAVYTRRGWEFVNFSIGRFIYVEAVDTYYHKNAGGSWVTGFGSQVTAANSVPLSAAINFGKDLIVENQTTTAPPGSPTVGTAYIIGPSATGAWAGLDAKIAICEVAGAFVIYTPTNGWAAYDKAANNSYTFNGTAWVSSAGAVVAEKSVFTSGTGSTVGAGSGDYTYSNGTPPTTAQRGITDSVILTIAAHKSNAELSFYYQAYVAVSSPDNYVVALFRDSEANAVDWRMLPAASVAVAVSHTFRVIAADTSSHDYKIRIMHSATDNGATSFNRREFRVRELS